MPSSDSEGFESADEGHGNPEKQDRRNRLSSSNHSDNVLETVQEPKKTSNKPSTLIKPVENEAAEGWDDFDVDDESIEQSDIDYSVDTKSKVTKISEKETKSQDTGWDDFEDWGQDTAASSNPKELSKPIPSPPEPGMTAIANSLAALTTRSPVTIEPPKPTESSISEKPQMATETPIASSGWGWGWTVDSILNTASAGINSLTTQVSQGLSTVLESGIGAPVPEELARANASEAAKKDSKSNIATPEKEDVVLQETQGTSDAPSSFGNLLSGVTKFVESTGTKVIAGSLDTLETIGKKTMEVLQDGDPGLAKKRAMLGLNPDDKIVLSQVLREAKARADEEDKIKEEKREAKEVHYENLFDDFEGLVHLEALEMLSRQINMRIEERLRGVTLEQRQEIKETLQQVAELCEMPDEDDEDEESHQNMSRTDALHERLQHATQDLGVKLQFQPLVKQYKGIQDWLMAPSAERTDKIIYKRAVGSLAQATALSVELYHKAAEMLLVKTRRSTADEADALTQMTVVLTKHISKVATTFTEELNSLTTEDEEQINTYITNIYLEAGNSSTYIQNAFQLALPILQIGAV